VTGHTHINAIKLQDKFIENDFCACVNWIKRKTSINNRVQEEFEKKN
jgi:uncharacterized protein involved in tolerance to divalent cations